LPPEGARQSHPLLGVNAIPPPVGVDFLFNTDTKLRRIAWLSAHEPKKKFDQLMHHFNEDSLVACFHELDGK
jgi:hypothetical protein